MLWSKRPHLGTRSFSNIHVQEHRILKKLLCDCKNSDFICASQHNCYLILHTRLPYIVAYAYNRDFWNLQPDEIGQNENFTKFVQIDKAVIQYFRSILQRVFFAPVIIPWNATHSKITTKCYDCITYLSLCDSDVPSSRSFLLLIFLHPFPFFSQHVFPRLISGLGGYLWVHPLLFLHSVKFSPSIC